MSLSLINTHITFFKGCLDIRESKRPRFRVDFVTWGPFLESPGNLTGPESYF